MNNRVSRMSRKFNNFFSLDSSDRFLSNTLEEACRSGNISLAKEAILRGARNLETAFQVASEKGHISIFQFLLSFDKRFLKMDTADNDSKDLKNFSIIRHQNNFTFNLIYAWTVSCRYNHVPLAKLLVTDYGITQRTGVYHVLKYIVHYGNMELLEWYLSKYPDSQKLFYESPDHYLPKACSGDSVNSIAIVKLLISKGAKNISAGLSSACLNPSDDYSIYKYTDNRYRIVVYLLTLGAAQYWQELYDDYIDHKRLVENGLPLDILKQINNSMFHKISERRSRVVDEITSYLITDLLCIVGPYVID